jgi:hypothetical protein
VFSFFPSRILCPASGRIALHWISLSEKASTL